MTKNTIPAFAVGPDGLFAGTMTKSDSDRDAEKGQVLEQEEMKEVCPAFIQKGRATTATREETPSQPTPPSPPKIDESMRLDIEHPHTRLVPDMTLESIEQERPKRRPLMIVENPKQSPLESEARVTQEGPSTQPFQ
ncbi:hypothetical protein BC826DRAFT_1104806 [Russula brevipes]|nr:hypothetical protein BC826DRAFT_1104806 [Russula brevipes]